MAKGLKTGGRKAGTPNKATKALKDAILAALDEVGGQQYLVTVAQEDPRTFCALLGKVLPMQLSGDPDNPVKVEFGWAS
jgi:hypothetical protein